MNRSSLIDRLGLRSKSRHKRPSKRTRLGVERLEERRLLSVDNLLVSTYNPTGGSSVLEYSEATNLRLPGGVYAGDHGLQNATGLAVAPDGSYYVSSLGSGPHQTGQVLHYSRTGAFLNVLGSSDANSATIFYPGTLAFGPNRNLYVADVGAGAIYQFDTTATAQQYQAADTVWLPTGFSPGGFAFAANSSHDLIVGDLNSGEVLQLNADGTTKTLIPSGSGINPVAILALDNGNLLIADSDLGSDPTGHHQIVQYDAATGTTSRFINLTTPVGTSQYGDAGLPPQPTSLLLDSDGNLLVGLAPSQNGDGAVEKFNIQTGDLIETIASGLGAPSGLALAPTAPSDILFSTYFETKGGSVLRYNDATQLPVPGGVATGTDGLGQAAGLAVAADGSYYVSSQTTYQVLHFSNSGAFLGVLGTGDKSPAPLEEPGDLAFGPDGNLYVADLGAGAIYQFDTASSTQQYLAAGTRQLPSGFIPGGLTFAANATHDLLVGNLNSGEVLQFNANGSSTALIAAGSGINPFSILALTNGNLLIADADLGGDPTGHHQIVEYNAATGVTSQFIDLTTPVGTGTFAGDPPQPSSLAFDADGNLLIGLSPDDAADGAVEKFNIKTGAMVGTIAKGVGDPSGLALVPSQISDLLVGNLAGGGVLRYSSANQRLAAGGVAPGANGSSQTAGVAVAPDGSYYVSSPGSGPGGSGQVLHYSNFGAFLNVLGASDGTRATLMYPGTVAFGPNGNLYVADLGAGVIDQFDTTSTTQQYLSTGTIQLPANFTPAGFTFASDAARELIVGDYNTGEVLQFNADGGHTTLIAANTPDPDNSTPGNTIFPIAMQELTNGNLLIADSNPGNDPAGHHQILEYDAATNSVNQLIDLTVPVDSSGDPPQPTSMLLAPDGNLLVGVSPNEFYSDGAVEEFDLAGRQLITTVASSIGAPAGLALAPPNAMTVPAGDWTNAGLTISATSDGKLHVYQTGTTTDVIPPQPAASVGEIQISGPDSAANTLTISFGDGSPVPPDGVFFAGVAGETNTVIIRDSTGSNAYSLNGAQLDLNNVPAVTMTNTQALTLDLGSGSLDLGGGSQAIGSIDFAQGSMTDGSLSSGAFAIQSGMISANLAGPGGLSKTGAGTATLSGTNNYQGGTAVSAGTLVVTASVALPAGTALTVGAGGTLVFSPPPDVRVPPALSHNGSPNKVVPIAKDPVSLSASILSADVWIVAPLRVQAMVPGRFETSISDFKAAAALLSSVLPPAQPAALPPRAASSSLWRSYAQSFNSGAAISRVPAAAGYSAWFRGLPLSSNSQNIAADDIQRIAILDSVLALYGSP